MHLARRIQESLELDLHLLENRCVFRIVDHVVQLVRVGLEIVEFPFVDVRLVKADELVAPVGDLVVGARKTGVNNSTASRIVMRFMID